MADVRRAGEPVSAAGTRVTNPRLTDADKAALSSATKVLSDVGTADYGSDVTALRWDLDVLHASLATVLGIVGRIGGDR